MSMQKEWDGLDRRRDEKRREQFHREQRHYEPGEGPEQSSLQLSGLGQKLKLVGTNLSDILQTAILAVLCAIIYLHHERESHVLVVLERNVIAQLYTSCVIGIPPELRWQNYREDKGDRCAWILRTHSNAFFHSGNLPRDSARP